MYRRLFIKGLLIVSMIGLLCGYAFAAQQSGQNERNQSTQRDPATAQQGVGTPGQMTQQPGAGRMAQQPMQLCRSSELIGKELKNPQNEELGAIHDLVLTPDYQQVSYAALAHGGVWGVGSKLFAVPWTAIKVGPDGKPTADISKQTLEQMSGFDDDNWPNQGNFRLAGAGAMGTAAGRSTTGQVGRTPSDQPGRPSDQPAGTTRQRDSMYTDGARERTRSTMPQEDEFSEGTSAAASMNVRNRRVSKLTGMSVRNPQNEDIGDIEDFVIDVPNGHVAYTIVSFGGFWGIGEKYAAVPTAAIDLHPPRGFARLDADRQTLESIAFDPGNWPDLSNRDYAQRLHETFKQEPYWTTFGYVAPGQQQAASQRAWGAQSEYMKNFNPDQITTIKGMVQSVGTFEPARGVSEGLRLRIKTTEGKTVTAHAGPMWYARQQNFYLKPGDEVTVTGSNTKIGWRSVIVATEIQKGSETLRLRSKTGEPLWSAQGQPGQPRQRSQQPSTMD